MEKRFVSFLLASLVVLFGFSYLQQAILGPEIEAQQAAAEIEKIDVDDDQQAGDAADVDLDDQEPNNEPETDSANAPLKAADADAPKRDKPDSPEPVEANVQLDPKPPAKKDERLLMLGSLEADSPYQMLVTFSNYGATVVRVELNQPKYTDLLNESGYLGNLALLDDDDGRCLIRTVAEGTPAFDAGLRGATWQGEGDDVAIDYRGDQLISINGREVETSADFHRVLNETKPGVSVELVVEQNGNKKTKDVKLVKRPLQLLQPEPLAQTAESKAHPASFLFTLHRIGDDKTRFDADELENIPSLHHGEWSVSELKSSGGQGPGLEFTRRLMEEELAAIGEQTQLELVKRYRLAKVDRDADANGATGYKLTLELEVRNLGEQPVELGYQIDGPTGLTPEGWWYSYKVHPTKMSVAGARDVVWRERDNKHKLFVCGDVNSHHKKNPDSPDLPLVDSSEPIELAYVGTDAQYFSAVMISDSWNPELKRGEVGPPSRLYDAAYARAVGPIDAKKKRKYTNVSTRLKSRPSTVQPGESIGDKFTIFLGPKEPKVLAEYGLDECVVYGWFWWVAKPMLWILHTFYWLTGKWSYGIAIILLTVSVRACLFPLGRQMARNAQKMQELAPEMKKIADKHKDVEKRSKAQQELFKKHNYNPLSGCGVLFVQTPVFLGLYRCIGTDIALRQAPLIPGLSWCSNLAGPDRFWNWEHLIPAALSSTTGWLGPYLNLLPLVAVGLILAQQKLFTPPPQDEQQQMQQSVMKFMMLFMCMIFFKFASGLCLYIIVSTLWGLGERLMLPKPGAASGGQTPAIAAISSSPQSGKSNGSNGSSSVAKKRKKRARKR